MIAVTFDDDDGDKWSDNPYVYIERKLYLKEFYFDVVVVVEIDMSVSFNVP